MFDYLFIVLIIFIAIILFVIFTLFRFKYSTPGNILIVYDKFRNNRLPRCIHGGGTFVLPFLQDYTYLSLKPITTIIFLPKCLTKKKEFRVDIRLFFSFCIGTDERSLLFASDRFMKMPETEINILATEIIKEQIIYVISSFLPENIRKENKEFNTALKYAIEPQLNKIGLTLISASITKMDYFKENISSPIKEEEFQ